MKKSPKNMTLSEFYDFVSEVGFIKAKNQLELDKGYMDPNDYLEKIDELSDIITEHECQQEEIEKLY